MHFDLLYSNSMCRQSSMPTSILIELLLSGGMRYECTHRSFSFVTSAILREMVTLMKYLGEYHVSPASAYDNKPRT